MPLPQLIAMAAVLAAIVWCVGGRGLARSFRLIRAEYTRQRIACGFALRRADIDGMRWCYVERAGDARPLRRRSC